MHGDEIEDTEDYSGSVLPAEVEEHAVPIPLTVLQPWHHPRKQYIRERQWKLYAERLTNKLKQQNGIPSGTVKYLTLPGTDYFDVEILGNAVNDAGLKLEATGFLADAEKTSIRARSQFRADGLIKRGLMEDTSITFPYRFEDLAQTKSQAHREVKARAPFQVVNIDACGSVAKPNAVQPNRIIDAIHELMNIQFSAGRTSWALFLTTDARSDNVSQGVREALKDAIRQNCNASGDFANGAIDLLTGGKDCDIEQAFAEAEGSNEKFLSMFSLGFAKWILHNADAVQWDVKSRQFYCYTTRPENDNDPSMACMAFEFSPRPVVTPDLFGAVVPPNVQENLDATDYSMQALARAQSMDNLDALLHASPEIRTNYANKQRELLVGAGYHATALAAFDEKFS